MSEEQWLGLEDFPTVADMAAFYAAQNGGGTPAVDLDSWQPRNLADLADTPPVEPTLGGLGFVYPGKRHVFSGPQESAKTLAAYVIGLEVIRSGETVVLIDFEMGPWDTKGRLVDLGATHDELANVLYVQPDVPATPTVIEYLIGLAPALAIIDAAAGAYSIQGLDDNKRIDVERFTEIYVAGFWRADIATIVLDHVVKNVEGRGNYAIGSERKVGGADVHLGFSVISPIKRGAKGVYKIVTHKDRGGHLKRGKLAEMELDSDPDTHAIRWTFTAATEGDDEHPFRPTHLMEKVSRFLETQTEPVSRNTVEEAKLGKRDYVREALDILTEESFLEESKGPNRARLVEVLKVFREDDDKFAPSSPHFARGELESSSPLRPSPYGGGEVGRASDGDVEESSSPRQEPYPDIPF